MPDFPYSKSGSFLIHISMKKKIILGIVALSVLVIASCSINGIAYNLVSDAEWKYFVDYQSSSIDAVVNNDTAVYIQEITAKDVRNALKKHKFTCVELWSPYCHNEVCQNVNYYDNIVKKYSYADFFLLKISRTYDYAYIETIVKRSHYDRQMYVIKYQKKYSKGMDRVHDRFSQDITGKEIKPRNSYFFFKDSTFIHSSDFLTENIIDSLLKCR